MARPRPSRTERRIAARLRDGDPRGLEELYELHGRAVFGVLLRTVGDHAAAEDLQQQVFTEAWRRGTQYDAQRAGLLTWLLTIARSRAIDHLRRRVPEPHDPAGAAALADGATFEAGTDALVDRWRLAALVQRLPEEERMLLRLRFADDLSQSEIAQRTGIPLGTVKTRMVRGLERLRVALEAEEEAPPARPAAPRPRAARARRAGLAGLLLAEPADGNPAHTSVSVLRSKSIPA